MNIKKSVKRLAVELDMTQRELAEKADMNPHTLASWCTDKGAPKLQMISQLCNAHGVKVSTFISWSETTSINE